MNKWSKIQSKVYREKIEEVDKLFVEVYSNTNNVKMPRSQWLTPLENWANKQIKESTSLKLSLQEFTHLNESLENINNAFATNYGKESIIIEEFHDVFINDYYRILESKANDLKLEITAELIEEKQFPLELFSIWYEEAHKLPSEQFNEELGNFWGDVWRHAGKGAGYGALAGGAAGGIPTGGIGTFAGAGLGGFAGGLAGGLYGGASHLLKRVWKYRQTQRNFEQTKQKALESLKKLKELSKGFDINPNFIQSLDSMIDQLGTTRAYRAAGSSTTPTDAEAEVGKAVNPMKPPHTDPDAAPSIPPHTDPDDLTAPGVPTPTPPPGSPTSSTVAPPVIAPKHTPSSSSSSPPAAPPVISPPVASPPAAPTPHSLVPSGLGSTATLPSSSTATPKPPRRKKATPPAAAPVPGSAPPAPAASIPPVAPPAAPAPAASPPAVSAAEPETKAEIPPLPEPAAPPSPPEPEHELESNVKDEKHIIDYYEKIKNDPKKVARLGIALMNMDKFKPKKIDGERKVTLKNKEPIDMAKFTDIIKELQSGSHDPANENDQEHKDAIDLANLYITHLREKQTEKAEDEALAKGGTPKETPLAPGEKPAPQMGKEEIAADLHNNASKYQNMSVAEFKDFLTKHNLYDLIPLDDNKNRPVGGHNSPTRGAAIIALKDQLGGKPPEPEASEPKIEPTTGEPVEDKKFSDEELGKMDLKKLKGLAKSIGIGHLFDDQSKKPEYVAELSNYYIFPHKYASDIAKGKAAKQESVIQKYKRIVQENKLSSLPMDEKVKYLKTLLRA